MCIREPADAPDARRRGDPVFNDHTKHARGSKFYAYIADASMSLGQHVKAISLGVAFDSSCEGRACSPAVKNPNACGHSNGPRQKDAADASCMHVGLHCKLTGVSKAASHTPGFGH